MKETPHVPLEIEPFKCPACDSDLLVDTFRYEYNLDKWENNMQIGRMLFSNPEIVYPSQRNPKWHVSYKELLEENARLKDELYMKPKRRSLMDYIAGRF